MKASCWFAILAVAACVNLTGWSQDTPPTNALQRIIVHPEHPGPVDFVTLEVVGLPGDPGDWVKLHSVILADGTVAVQLDVRPSPFARPFVEPWHYRVDLGVLELGTYHVQLFLNGIAAGERDFTVGEVPPPGLLLDYSKSGGFAGIHYSLAANPNGEFKIHWLVNPPSGSLDPVGTAPSVLVDCSGHLTNMELGELQGIFTQYMFADWDPVYGYLVPDGFVWSIMWQGRQSTVFQGGELPDKVEGLVHAMDGFAERLARRCLNTPPPPRPLLVYNEIGGFIGLNNHLLVMPNGDYLVHWLVLNSSAPDNSTGVGLPDCTGRLNNEQLGRLEGIFNHSDFEHWDPVYGAVPGATDPNTDRPIIADGRVWRIEWKGKVVNVYEGGPIPDKVMGLIHELDEFALDLALRCLPIPPPPGDLRGEIRSVRPEHPSASDVLTIVVGGAFPDPSYHVVDKQVVLIEHEVHVKIDVVHDASGPVITVIQPWEETVHVGPLPAGAWPIILEINDHMADKVQVYVSPLPAPNDHEVIILVFPEIPNASTPVALEVLGTFHDPRTIVEHSWAQENHTFNVTIKSATAPANTVPGTVTGVLIPWRVREDLGLLSAGEYHVVVHLDEHGVAEKNFVVQAASNVNPGDLSNLDRGGAVDVDSNGRVDYEDLMRLMRYWHVE